MSFTDEISAKVIADSMGPEGTRLTTMEVTFHRFILAEVNTHRKLSRNSASSRAIPLETMLERASRTPAIPLKFSSEQKGMSGGWELTGEDYVDAAELLLKIQRSTTGLISEYLDEHPDKSTRLHKSVLNRPLEWFMWHTAIISSTEWDNLFHQRISPDAQPEFDKLATLMEQALTDSTPTQLLPGDWHLPYTSLEERSTMDIEDLVKISTSRCARVSYLTHDGQRDVAEDLRMYDETLFANGHWSPMEHPAMCVTFDFPSNGTNYDRGWEQLRSFAQAGAAEMIPSIATSVRVHSGQEVSEDEMRRSAAAFEATLTDEERAAIEATLAEHEALT